MARATITTKSGATAILEGTAEEVAKMAAGIEGRHVPPASARSIPVKAAKPTPSGLVTEMIADGFFAEPKDIGSIGRALRDKGRFYPVTTLSPTLLRLVRKKQLRRIKDKQRWTYVE